TCQTARDQEVPTFQSGRVPTPLPTMNELQSTYVDCCVTQQGEEHQWRVRSPRSVTRRRRAQWSGYRPPRPGLSTPIVNKSSHGGPPKKIQRFQSIRRAANGRIKAAPQKISKKACPPAGSGGALDASPGTLSLRPSRRPRGPDRRGPIQAGPSHRPWQTSPIQGWTELHPRPDLVPRRLPDGLLAPGRSGNFFHIRRRTRATIPRRSGTDELESRDASGGCRRFSWGQRKAILQMTQPSSDIRETSRDLYPSSCS
ncbi:hypothetical protein ABIB95_006452, partial [Bradyrhizobium sp. LA2.1]